MYIRWHRDIKPDNILCVQGKFKLADMGFAQFVKETGDVPKTKLLGGTET
jgi:serine/threonine protein kinase